MDSVARRILEVIEGHREEILDVGRDIYDHAELGYKEFRTSSLFAERMRALGLPVQTGLAITGVKARLNEERGENASIALLGEMDALRIPSHAHANPETGAAHCCGHHAQMAGLIGAAIALSDPEVSKALDGQVTFFAVPAEEYGELAFKKGLMDEGKIAYGGGKCELIRIGAFDDIDLAVAHHIGQEPGIRLGDGSCNGFVSKVYAIHGKASHAASSPEEGVNALNAAALGLQALAFQRETFRDQDSIRVHPILTRGGDLVNVVPETAIVETLVRGRTLEAIEDASRKADRSFLAGAMALGAGITIETMPGYMPGLPQAVPREAEAAVRDALGDECVRIAEPGLHTPFSTDLGDLQHLLPVYSFRTGGMTSALHSSDFDIVDEESAYLDTARVFAILAYALLRDGARLARREARAYRAAFRDRVEYGAYLDSFQKTEEHI